MKCSAIPHSFSHGGFTFTSNSSNESELWVYNSQPSNVGGASAHITLEAGGGSNEFFRFHVTTVEWSAGHCWYENGVYSGTSGAEHIEPNKRRAFDTWVNGQVAAIEAYAAAFWAGGLAAGSGSADDEEGGDEGDQAEEEGAEDEGGGWTVVRHGRH